MCVRHNEYCKQLILSIVESLYFCSGLMVVDFVYTPLQRIFEYSPPSTLIKMIKKSTVTEKYL